MAKAKSLEDKEPITWAVFQGHTGNGVESASSHHAVGFLVEKALRMRAFVFIKNNMLIAILIVSILIFLSITVGFRATNERINDLEATLDEIKKKTDKLGTHNY